MGVLLPPDIRLSDIDRNRLSSPSLCFIEAENKNIHKLNPRIVHGHEPILPKARESAFLGEAGGFIVLNFNYKQAFMVGPQEQPYMKVFISLFLYFPTNPANEPIHKQVSVQGQIFIFIS